MLSVQVIVGILFFSCTSTNTSDLEKILNPGALPYLRESKLIQVSSHDTSGGNNDMITIPAGKESTILDVPGPGVITRIWFRVNSDDPFYLRRILIKMYWDEEENPSVEVPIGDFFGSGFFYKQYVTPYMGMSYGGFTCFFPMPFEGRARIIILNESGIELKGFYYQINYQKLENPISTDIGYFHAYWHRDFRTDYDNNYTILKTTGKGHIVGVNMSIQSYDGTFKFLNGDDKIFVDGEKKPSVYGTGTEDYFSSGWYFKKGEYAGPYNGLVLKDDSLGRISAYRFHIPDPIPFKRSIDFSIGHGLNNSVIADYSSTVYWYQEEPHVPFPPMLRSGLRIPLRFVPSVTLLEAEKLTFNLGKIRSRVMDMRDYGTEWSGSKQLLIETGPKDEFSVILNHLDEIGYDIDLYYTKGPDYANVDVYLGEEKVGQIKGYSPMLQPGGRLSINYFRNVYNSLVLQFVVAGKDSLSRGYYTGLDGIRLVPKRSFIPQWRVIGPFPNKIRPDGSWSGIDSVFRPELGIDTIGAICGLNGKPIHWQIINTPKDGYVSFDPMVNPDQPGIFYALVYIFSPEPLTASLFVGSDDAIKVFYNGNKIFVQRGERLVEPDKGRIFIKVNKGWNKLLLKIENRSGLFGFYARILDRENIFSYSINEKMLLPPAGNLLKPERKK